MDSATTPPHRSDSHSQTKSASRLARMADFVGEEVSRLAVGPVSSSPKKRRSSSTLTLRSSGSLPFQDLLLLSPSPLRRERTHASDRVEMVDEPVELARSRRRRKTKGAQSGLFGCASPKGIRRSRRRSEVEVREDRDFSLVDEIDKPRKVGYSGKSNKEKLSLVPSSSLPSSTTSPKTDMDYRGNLDQVGRVITDLIMWKDVAKSTLWFGFGCLCFLSSCFAGGISFSIISAVSQIGLLVLGASFFSNTISQRNNIETKRDLELKEHDILQFLRIILPAANLAISKLRVVFSGEPSITLKVAPFLLLGAEYGRLITLWRLCVTGYFISFTVPKLCACYHTQIKEKVNSFRCRLFEAWGACSHKKIVVALVVTAFWNLSTLKTRVFTAFISVVILRYYRQNIARNLEGEVARGEEQEALIDAEVKEEQQALVVVS